MIIKTVPSTKSTCRLFFSITVVAFFVLFILTASIIDITSPLKRPAFPDFSQYKYLQTVSETRFPIHPHDKRRIIAVGDIHAMNHSLSALLAEVSYDPHFDTLLHLGDIVTKGKPSSSAVLDFMATNRILGVRGNNDQKVIEWRTWMDWILSLQGGRDWLEEMDSHWSHLNGVEHNDEFDAWLKRSKKDWSKYIPSGWELLGKHYKIARDLTREHYNYLLSLPIILHAPTAHTYFVHAGLLPANPILEVTDPSQPLSHWPTPSNPNDDADLLRSLQELALLKDVPQNADPWVLMNIRSLKDKGRITDSQKGTPWSHLWNDVMSRCSGFDAAFETSSGPAASRVFPRKAKHRAPLPCFPSMVVYGHAAARDLDVKRWSIGVDTGCAYGRHLTAVVLDSGSLSPRSPSNVERLSDSLFLQDSFVPFGDEGKAQIIGVDC